MSSRKEWMEALVRMFSAHLITYPGTTYDWTDLKEKIDAQMQNRHCSTTVLHQENKYVIGDVGFLDVLAFHLYRPLIGFRWRRFLSNKSPIPLNVMGFAKDSLGLIRAIVRLLRVISPTGMMASRMDYLRSINISASHLAAWREAIATDCEWALVFEDDGHLESAEDLEATFDLLERQDSRGCKVLVNLSVSFRFPTLGVEEIIRSSTVETYSGKSQEVIFTSTPFTNTLCAVALSRPLLEVLVPFAERAALSRRFRGIAIDFQLNRFLLERSEELDIRSIHLNPGIIQQGSIIRKKPVSNLR